MANYKRLAELIASEKGSLCKELKGQTLPSNADNIKRKCIDYVEHLTCKDSEYMNQLSLLEQDLLSPVLKVIETLYSSDIELSKRVCAMLTKERTFEKKTNSKASNNTATKEYGSVMAGAAGGTLLATICKPSSWGVILLGSVISAILGKVLYKLYVDKNDKFILETDDKSTRFPEYPLTIDDIDSIIEGLEVAGDCIDKVLLTYRKHLDILKDDFKKQEETYKLDKRYIGVLESFQGLLGNLSDMDDSPVVSDSIKKITQILSKQGFEAVDYNEETKGMFNIKEDDISSIEQFSPAIIKKSPSKDILVLKGDVVIPFAKKS